MPFQVGPDVLVPRPETEHQVVWAISWLRERERERVTVVDVGTGPGAIAIGIVAAMGPHWQGRIIAADVSSDALSVAPQTARDLISTSASPSSRVGRRRGCGARSFHPRQPPLPASRAARRESLSCPLNLDWRSTAARMVSISSVDSSPTRRASSRLAEHSVWRSTPPSATTLSTWLESYSKHPMFRYSVTSQDSTATSPFKPNLAEHSLKQPQAVIPPLRLRRAGVAATARLWTRRFG